MYFFKTMYFWEDVMKGSMTGRHGSRYAARCIGGEEKKECRFFIFIFLFLVVGVVHPLADESRAGAEPARGIVERSRDTPEKSMADNRIGSEPIKMSLRDFVRLVREKNEQIGFQDSELAISREAVKGAKAIFEPAFISSYQYQDDKRRNTVQELVNQGFISDFQEKSHNYQVAVEGLVPTGGRLRVGYSMRDFSNNIAERYNVERESLSVIGVSVTQPLLRGGGVTAAMAGIKVAQADADIALQNYRGQMMRVIAEATASYWELHLAREKYKVRKESERNAEEILRDNIVRVKTGKMAETEVLEAEAGLALRKSLVSEAKQMIIAAANSVRTFISSSAAETMAEIEPAETLYLEEVKLDFTESLAKAFKRRAEYLSTVKKMEREDIRVVFAKNQTWPQLDLKGSYNLNGLADTPGHSWEDSWKRDYPTWSVGIELRIPLGGDKKSRSELAATRQRKRQALLELKAVEVSLANALDTAIQGVRNVREQVGHYAGIVDMNRRLLQAEVARFHAGKSNSRVLLEREEELNKAKEAEIESLVRYKKSLFQLELAEGSLLVNHGVEVMEVGLQ
jgi:outer membrane protein TolC